MNKVTAALKKNKEKSDLKKQKGAQEEVLQELFHDMYADRKKIYKVNFFRGVFFGIGTFLGGTVVVALVIWFLTQFVDIPGIGEFFERLLRVIEQTPPPSSN